MNKLLKNGICGIALAASAMAAESADCEKLAVDFNSVIGHVRPELHSSGFGPQICSCPPENIKAIKSMGFKASRTHDWGLINHNQRVCDYFHIFPLMHLDAKDPKNYVFAPTDYLLKRTREELGHEIFFRLGTSIEHSGKVHFNTLIPDDFDKVAEIFAATIRHYNHGWANGYNWGIKYWEIWNEPDLSASTWSLPENEFPADGDKEGWKYANERRQQQFVKFFVTCLKRLKSEFPEAKIGGPALSGMNTEYFQRLLTACKESGVAPDFISWHHYGEDTQKILNAIVTGRELCDQVGFLQCELIINEWHFFGRSDYNWHQLRSADPEVVSKIWHGPRSHNGIDSSCYNLALLSQFQTSKLNQAYYYGCNNIGSWGFMNEHKQKYKVFYGLQLFGKFVKDFTQLCAANGIDPQKEPVITVLAGKSADGKKQGILISDYRVRTKELEVAVKGVPENAKVTALVHDYTHNLEPTTCTFADGKLTLHKNDEESAAFLVTFE